MRPFKTKREYTKISVIDNFNGAVSNICHSSGYVSTSELEYKEVFEFILHLASSNFVIVNAKSDSVATVSELLEQFNEWTTFKNGKKENIAPV